ncbi:Inner membrane transporter rhtA [Actinomyces bovis]|uniref:Inner membrane transporter rhtA n=1 Tax=Actinomyces bovis TaxID=1658 RepID=A0ABY1VR12_9ACTO|nr:EamA family transporter [Actinomyces bovis]SPT53503.1 Inner membrane transporter rhtA [Actinomyces bovis]VEG55420.1 Inner membrane transporter rhtA [Actinomyces israelii]
MPVPTSTLTGRVRGILDRVPAPLLFCAAGGSAYIGAGFAVTLFALMPPTTAAWWRITIGAIVLMAWRRPWRLHWTRRELATAAMFGLATATMNVIFYAAIKYLPLGTAVSLEFVGPVAVALATGRGWRPRVAAFLALAGVASISGLGLDLSDSRQRLGVLLALAAGTAWAGYILLGRKVASAGSGLDSLALASVAGFLFYLPLAATTAGRAFNSVGTLLTVLGVGLASTVIPFVLDQVTLKRLQASTFSLLSALLPATSLAVGVLMLGQVPNAWELLGLLLVSVAVALAR